MKITINIDGKQVDRAKVGFAPQEANATIKTSKGDVRVKVFETSDGQKYYRLNGTIRRVKETKEKK